MLSLTVTIDPNSGFCFGVEYAIEMAEELLQATGKLYCLGDIVHNDEEVRRLKQQGLIIISSDELRNLHNEKVLIRAHGEPPSTYQIAVENNLELIDASCPVVLKLQNRIKNSFDKGEHIYIFGKHGHAEVVGLLGQTSNQATVFQEVSELELDKMQKNVTLYSQTTKSPDKFYEIKNFLEDSGVDIRANDTICRQVSNRDKELREFVRWFDKIVFVSGTKSSNGKALFNICKKNNSASYFISQKSQISSEWFNTGDRVGVCGATSTPMWLMEEVRNELKTL